MRDSRNAALHDHCEVLTNTTIERAHGDPSRPPAKAFQLLDPPAVHPTRPLHAMQTIPPPVSALNRQHGRPVYKGERNEAMV